MFLLLLLLFLYILSCIECIHVSWCTSVRNKSIIIIIIITRCKYFDPCYARATVVRARFLAAAFSDGSHLAHVNGPYLRHVTFCIVRGPPLFIASPICGSRAAARGTPASPILAVMKLAACRGHLPPLF